MIHILIIHMDKSPYTFEKLTNKSGFLNDTVDATYIIHLENNGRYEHIKTQLEKYHITSTVYILHNLGYKSGLKPSNINCSALDLIDAYLTVFADSINKNYSNILILEDDFVFDDKILDKSHTDRVNKFIRSQHDTNFIYYLGCVPYMIKEYKPHHLINIMSSGTHSIIYSKKFIKETIRYTHEQIKDWDYYASYASPFVDMTTKIYMYYIPLCYQPFPETENSKSWGHGFGDYKEFLCKLTISIFKKYKMDTKFAKGFKRYYKIAIKLDKESDLEQIIKNINFINNMIV